MRRLDLRPGPSAYLKSMFRALDLWLPAYLRRRPPMAGPGPVHLLIAVCDHFEPLHGTDKAGARARLAEWKKNYPRLVRQFHTADSPGPRHTFFYPVEQYDPDILGDLEELCAECDGEVEIHLHHDRDTRTGVQAALERGKENLSRHGFLSRDEAGRLRYGFIHGNWALNHSHPEGRGCGVSDELEILRDTGCYGDFTMPAAPDRCQVRTVNRIYRAPWHARGRAYALGPAVQAGGRPNGGGEVEGLLCIQGPLGLNWVRRKWGLVPRVENGELTSLNPGTPDRVRLWRRLGIGVEGQPNWVFVKLHTHGGVPWNQAGLFGDPARRWHAHLRENYDDGRNYQLHYVSAREMANLAEAAQRGEVGNPGPWRNMVLRLRHQSGGATP